jgi:RNA polymerase sigma factor (sigma-70 family)
MAIYNSNSTIELLVEGCKKNDRLAQQYLYQRLFSSMLGVAMRYANNRDDAEASLNIAFLKVFQSIHNYTGPAPFPHWVYRIVVHTSIDELRKTLRIKYLSFADFPIEGSADNSGLEKLGAEDIYACIQKLEPTTRTVFSLYEIEGYKHTEVAEMVGIAENTSKWYLAKAKKELKSIIEDQYGINDQLLKQQ